MILLLGATGLLGNQVLDRLIKNRWPVRVLIRGHLNWQSSYTDRLRANGVSLYSAEFNDPEKLENAFRGCSAVINCIGCLNTKNRAELRTANLDTVTAIVEIVEKCAVPRLIQVSCLGANENSESECMRLKWLAESKVRECKAQWTILKPSYMFGEKFELLNLVSPLLTFPPCLLVVGSGFNLIQPIWVEDVADSLMLALYDKTTVAQTYELGGPETFSMVKFLEMFRQQRGIGGPTVNMPSAASSHISSLLAKLLPQKVFYPDLVELLTVHSASMRADLKDKFAIHSSRLTDRLAKLGQI